MRYRHAAAATLLAVIATVSGFVPAAFAADTTAPSKPTGLTANAVSSSQVNLAWNASTDNVGVVGYKVYRGTNQVATTNVPAYSETGLLPKKTYSYTVAAYDAAGNTSAKSATASATTPDTLAPTVPADFSATPSSVTKVKLAWSASTDDVAVNGYRIYRDGALIVTASKTAVTYTNSGLSPATTYSYTISAIDTSNNESAQSAAVSATTSSDTSAPSRPAGLSATPVSHSRIDLSWTASTDNVGVSGYRIYRAGALVATIDNVTTYQDTGLAASTAYSYTVQAFDASGNSSTKSVAASATTLQPPDVTPPSVPAGLSAAAVSNTRIDLAWGASTDNVGVTGYEVLVNGTQVATTTATSFSSTGLTPVTTYTFAVRAYDAAGNRSGLASASATTPNANPPDTAAPTVSITAPAAGSTLAGSVTITASAADNFGVVGVQFVLDGVDLGSEVTSPPYAVTWNTTLAAKGAHTLAARARDVAGNVGTATPVNVTTTDAVAATLGAHGLSFYACGGPGGPLSVPAMATQASGSTLLAWAARGNIDNFAADGAPYDNKGNAFSMLGPVRDFGPIWPDSGEAMYVVPQAVGGANHVVTLPAEWPNEITFAAVEIRNGGVIQDAKWNKVLNGTPHTSLNVTTTGPATLVAFWTGDGQAPQMTSVPNNAFTVIDSQLVNTECAIQSVVAAREVTAAGTYNVTWTTSPAQGGHMWLIAVQSPTP